MLDREDLKLSSNIKGLDLVTEIDKNKLNCHISEFNLDEVGYELRNWVAIELGLAPMKKCMFIGLNESCICKFNQLQGNSVYFTELCYQELKGSNNDVEYKSIKAGNI